MKQRLPLLFIGIALGIAAAVCFDYYLSKNAPLYRRLERQWSDDVQQLEASKKLPPGWFDVKDLEIYGGTPETKQWLARIKVPLKTKPTGLNKLEVLVVAWEEEGKRGALVQYNLVDLKTQNNYWELARTFILSQ